LKDAGKNFAAISLLAGRHDCALTRATPIKLALNIIFA
jgi:hypothetical protein